MRNVNHKLRKLLKNYDTSIVILPAVYRRLFHSYHFTVLHVVSTYDS